MLLLFTFLIYFHLLITLTVIVLNSFIAHCIIDFFIIFSLTGSLISREICRQIAKLSHLKVSATTPYLLDYFY